MTHTLKTLPQYWDAVARGDKTFEVRRDDRGFQKGDLIDLVKTDEFGSAFTFNGEPMYVLHRRIRWILTGGQFGVEPGFVVLQLEAL